ncbi:MAG: hypothetical protein ACQEWV_13955 [Bacillota bacterium]
MIQTLLTNLIASSIVMKRNLDWHRRLLFISIPLFVVFMMFQTEYIIYRIKNDRYSN